MRRSRVVSELRERGGRALPLAAVLALLVAGAPPAQAQDAVLEALRQQRAQARAAQALAEMPPRAEAFGPVELPMDFETPRRFSPRMPVLQPPAFHLAPLAVLPARPTSEPAPSGLDALTEIRIVMVAPAGADAFVLRFGDALWASATGLAQTPLDALPTPEVRARLHAVYGGPTRTPEARGRPDPSHPFQFEYWFVANDSIPLVVTDRSGPFGEGVALIADEAHLDIIGAVYEALAERLLAEDRIMPYVDYYYAADRRTWYRTGYDGTRYYALTTDPPAWALRTRDRGAWFEFR